MEVIVYQTGPPLCKVFWSKTPTLSQSRELTRVSLARKSRYEYRGNLPCFLPFSDTLAGKLRRQDGLGLDASPKPEMMYDFTYERSALATRFNELAGIKAGLNARWRELENEARRAGVPPGWLRP
jgi:hypothetical protein